VRGETRKAAARTPGQATGTAPSNRPRVTTGWLETRAGRLEFLRHQCTDDNRPTLVFLHEGLGCVELWKDFPQRVAQATGCDTLVYSRVGYGRSDPVELPRPLTYMHREGLEILPDVLDATNIRHCILIGHSDGASIAIIHAGGVRDPRVLALVLLAPHVFNEPVCVASIRQAREAFPRGLRDKLAVYHGDNVDCAFRGWNDAWLDPGFLDWNIEEYLPTIDVPVLVIQGRDDEYGTVNQVDAIAQQCGAPVRTLLLEACRHSPQRDQAEASLEAITTFVDSVCTDTRDRQTHARF
jgi:pimeloyl-ACP methyl ester carboxylesterase